jgi:hypothetical protein
MLRICVYKNKPKTKSYESSISKQISRFYSTDR